MLRVPWIWIGSYGLSSRGKAAAATRRKTATPKISPLGVVSCRASRCSTIAIRKRSVVLDAGIEHAVREVDDQAAQHDGDRHEQHGPLDHRVIARLDSIAEQPPNPGEAEHHLHD